MAVASAGLYANNLHLAPDRQPHQHLITHFYRPDALPDAQPTVTKHAKVFCKSTLELERRTCLGVYVPLRGPKIAGRWVPGCHEASAAQAWCPTAPHRQCGHHARSDETAHWLPLDWILMMASLTTNHSRNHDYDLAKIKICRHKHTHNRLTALCLGLPGWAGTRKNIHPLTPIMIIRHPLSTSSIYHDPQYPSSSICVLDIPLWQPLSRSSLVFLLVWDPLLHTPYISSPNDHHKQGSIWHDSAIITAWPKAWGSYQVWCSNQQKVDHSRTHAFVHYTSASIVKYCESQ